MPSELRLGRVYRLPTEAEWEYACRASTATKYSFGDNESLLGEYAWFDGNSNRQIRKVGTKKPNPWGFHDMHGNVFEWCNDWYGEYGSTAVNNPRGPSGGIARVARGGSCRDGAASCRSAHRNRNDPSNNGNLGLRIALSLPRSGRAEAER